MKKVKRSSYEIVVIAVVVALALALSFSLYASRANYQKGNLMVHELAMMRSAILLYKNVEKRNPGELKDLVTGDYEVEGMRRPFLDRLPMSKGGKFIDPFGNPYKYNPDSGWVSSTTPGYERW